MEQYKHFQDKLLKEKSTLETELVKVGRINPSDPNDWEPVANDLNIPQADWNERADQQENFVENIALEHELETQYRAVQNALKNIEEGKYGKCVQCGKMIEVDRLEANPSAEACKLCM